MREQAEIRDARARTEPETLLRSPGVERIENATHALVAGVQTLAGEVPVNELAFGVTAHHWRNDLTYRRGNGREKRFPGHRPSAVVSPARREHVRVESDVRELLPKPW